MAALPVGRTTLTRAFAAQKLILARMLRSFATITQRSMTIYENLENPNINETSAPKHQSSYPCALAKQQSKRQPDIRTKNPNQTATTIQSDRGKRLYSSHNTTYYNPFEVELETRL
ncbi:unnamed protein product [Ceratitis capitata]|uniref:(Mediterranean fruit fly) hypothetical protein n=1 Tax=Ceratitis capitata TaxID=7213 RepID=A0A811US44_CERCA|nr:unnamed protein product [Ceratitis capitata]